MNNTQQQIVEPAKIETELQHIWEKLSKEHKMRASLFNLIVVNRLSQRTDYFRNVVQKIVEKFPCRILFISEDLESSESYLKTAISVVFPLEDSDVACDQIDIGFAGDAVSRVPFVILPHFLPDLPIYLLWTEDPSKEHPLFDPLLKFATRVIFDSESTENLPAFTKKLCALKKEKQIDIADLNWARTEEWRDLISSSFNSKERIDSLYTLSKVELLYNEQKTEFFSHLKIQTLYFLAWLSSRLNWKFQKPPFTFLEKDRKIEATLKPAKWEKAPPGALLSTELISQEGFHFAAKRTLEDPHRVKIEISTKEQCEIPYHYLLRQTVLGHSLVKEICTKGTSSHFLEMLHQLTQFEKTC